jgi:hypothetical protein
VDQGGTLPYAAKELLSHPLSGIHLPYAGSAVPLPIGD